MRRETKLMHYGRSTLPAAANPPVVRASTIMHDTVDSFRDTKARRQHDDMVMSYGRRGTTTTHALASAIADLESADAAFLFPSGVAALVTAISAFVGAGDHLLIVDKVFGPTRSYCENQLRRNGVEVDYFPWNATDLSSWVKPKTKAVIVESPTSLTFEVMDLPALNDSAKSHGLTVIADNTYGSSWLYLPLELGCDVSVIAGTKYLGGHADLMMGVACARGEACDPLRSMTFGSGQTLSPDDAYACLRGMRTLSLRLAQQGTSSLAIAEWMSLRPEVARVYHPGLEGHPGHAIWKRDAAGSNGLLSVMFHSEFDLDSFLDRLNLFAIGSSWGGFESLALPFVQEQARKEAAVAEEVPPPMLRLHIGLEHIDDLIEDLRLAFER